MRTMFRNAMLVTTTLVALGAYAAIAATPPSAGNGGTVAQPATKCGDRDIAGKVEQRIADLHAALKITTGQEAPWDAFAAIMRANAMSMDQAFQRRMTGMAAMNAMENMQSYAEMSMQHAEGVAKMVPAFRTLYGALTPEQKQVADREFIDRANHGPDRPKG